MAYINELVKDCLQFERAFCSAECPFNLDIRDFVGKLQQGRFNVAYKTYQQTVGFPGIVSAICHEPCKNVCPMQNAGGAISLRALEKASMNYARNKNPDQYNMPLKDKKIAIIGAGISGLACALRLATKKYQVTVFEKTDRIGGHLYGTISPEIFLEDIKLQFMYEDYTLNLNTEITDLEELDFDAIYVATGKGGDNFGLERNYDGAFAANKQGVFLGGSLTGANTMQAIAQGLNVTAAIERYLKIGLMNQPEEPTETKLIKEAIRIIPGDIINPRNGVDYSKEEAVDEAKRCLKCACDACNHYSPLMNYFKKFPKKITEEVEISIHPSSLDGAATVATRLMSTCNHCGLCKEVCPVNIDTGEFLLQSHRTMRELGKMPWAFHEFFLRDMEFANQEAALARIPDGFETSSYMFFPGCQLGASDERLVLESYRFLLEHFPDTALMLQCCGAPAEWAGNESIHMNVLEQIRTEWIKLGKPTAIFACPTCKKMFNKYLPEIKGEFIYKIIEEKNKILQNKLAGETVTIFDPCSGRYETGLQDTIRNLAVKAGLTLEALPMEKNMAQCCSYGGQVSIAHPQYANYMIHKNIKQSDLPYITYCSNCRDIFAKSEKKVFHILDFIFNLESEPSVQPTVSERQNRRLRLKYNVLKEFWKEDIVIENTLNKLQISDELKAKLDKSLILETDILKVIENCELSGSKLFTPDKETFTGYMQIGNTTYWVEYRILNEDYYEVVNSYCHRMKIER